MLRLPTVRLRLRDALVLVAVVAVSLYAGMRLERARTGAAPPARGVVVLRTGPDGEDVIEVLDADVLVRTTNRLNATLSIPKPVDRRPH
jgi:hypothetical protein